MKKTYSKIEIVVVPVSTSDIITASPDINVRSTGVTGDEALAPGRRYDSFDDYDAY